MFSTSLAIVGHYFHARQGLALGIVMAGAALGGVIFPIVLNRLLNSVGLSFECMCLSLIFQFLRLKVYPTHQGTPLILNFVLDSIDQDLRFHVKWL